MILVPPFTDFSKELAIGYALDWTGPWGGFHLFPETMFRGSGFRWVARARFVFGASMTASRRAKDTVAMAGRRVLLFVRNRSAQGGKCCN